MTDEVKLMHEATDEALLEESPAGLEAKQSISFTGYYKGFSVTITKRDLRAKVKPLIDNTIEALDYMLEKGFMPSWNAETNRENKDIANTKWLGEYEDVRCATCGEKTTMRTGTSKKGKAWKGLFCSSGDKNHTVWL